jgi:hypothetical protein
MIAAPERDVNPVSLMAQDPDVVPDPHTNERNPHDVRPGGGPRTTFGQDGRAMADVHLTSSRR